MKREGRRGRPSRRSDVFDRPLEEEAVLYDPADSVMHTLNATAALIWRLCDGTHTPEEIARGVCEKYDGDPERVLKDVHSTLEQLHRKKLLKH
ncbi:MAG: PqqD family protein [Candidatus Tectomicrobia bacterium]|nr:PqqD family protein [Candidatus Tectomicrobia bacterium]